MNFKKHICLFLIFSLLVFNNGMAINIHYCEDEIASISLNPISSLNEIEDDCCGGIEENPACCDDKLIESQADNDQLIFKSFCFDIPFFFDRKGYKLIPFLSKINFTKSQISANNFCVNQPPLYLLYSQYTFYA